MEGFAAVILAAGKSTRMKSDLPKPLHNLCGKPVTRHVIDACHAAGLDDVIVVIGHESARVKARLGEDVSYVVQRQQLGTGHACAQAKKALGETLKHVVVLPGDAPLIRPETLKMLCDRHISSGSSATILSAILSDAGHYGRIVRKADGDVEKIVEAKDASPEILAIREINTSVYVFDADLLFKKLKLLKPRNIQAEYYLTDVIQLMVKDGKTAQAVVCEDATEALGINNRIELAELADALRRRKLSEMMLSGVTVAHPNSTWVDVTVTVGADSVIQPFTIIEGGTSIGERCGIGPFAHIADSTLGDDVVATFCRVVGRVVSDSATIGPFENVDGESLSRWFTGMNVRSKKDGHN